jgi:two-component system sensor histidine kinase TctE
MSTQIDKRNRTDTIDSIDVPVNSGDVKTSLKFRLMRHVLLPLALVWLLGTMLSTAIANYFVQQAFDRSLLDDAYMVAGHVKLKAGHTTGLDFNISPTELQSLLFDQSESVAFALFREDGSLLAGHPGLTTPSVIRSSGNSIEFENIVFQGSTMRAVVLRQEQPATFTVVIAQTALSRTQLLKNLLAYTLIPELLLLVLIGAWLRWIIGKDLQPLTELMQLVQTRKGSDFSPLQVNTSTRDLENLGNAVNAMLGRIEAGLKAQKEFTGNVAHELRTPLAGIRALAEYGLESSQTNLLQSQLRKIRESSIRASHLTDQLLALAIADEADIEMKAEWVSLNELITSAIVARSAIAREMNIDLGATGIESDCPVWGSQVLIEGLLNNLLDNAMRYGQPVNGGAQEVTVSVMRTADGVNMKVSDNGPGIAMEDREKILKRGVKGANNDGSNKGMGLGLSIVKRYAELLDAQFWLENSTKGPGLEAHVIFKFQNEVSSLAN